MQMLGLAMRSNRQLQSLSQVRVWLPDGVPVERLAENDGPNVIKPSNNFADFAYWLLTNDLAGLGALREEWLDVKASSSRQILQGQQIYFDGAILTKSTSANSWLSRLR